MTLGSNKLPQMWKSNICNYEHYYQFVLYIQYIFNEYQVTDE